jgi:tyrosine-protein phosphatase SIW14
MRRSAALAAILAASAWTAASPALAAPDIKNFDEVEPGFYRGGMPDRRDLEELKALGVRTVVDCTEGDRGEKEAVERLGMDYEKIPWDPSFYRAWAYDFDAIARRFLEIVDDPSKRPVFVHCVNGRDRTGTLCAIYRMERQGRDLASSLKEMKRYGFNPVLHHHLVRYLASRWKRLRDSEKISGRRD